MENLVKLELFKKLSDSSQEVSNDEMHKAYGNFVNQVQHLNQSQKDYDVIFRILNLTRIEFMVLQTEKLYEQGEKCVKKTLLSKSNLVYRI